MCPGVMMSMSPYRFIYSNIKKIMPPRLQIRQNNASKITNLHYKGLVDSLGLLPAMSARGARCGDSTSPVVQGVLRWSGRGLRQ